jgi:putative tryptophan/tyrosine transport system substrate-binding protein
VIRFWIFDFEFWIRRTTSTRLVCFGLAALLFALSLPAEAQQAKVYRVGYLLGRGSSPPQEFIQALHNLGYVEGKNIIIEHRSADSKREHVPDLAAELVRLKVDIIVTEGTGSTAAAKKVTTTIPIVMAESTDPVGTGVVASLARPGGNITGLTAAGSELAGKYLELLKEIVPRLSRVVVAGPPVGSPSEDFFIKEARIPARALKLQLIRVPANIPDDYENVFRVASKEGAQALLARIPPYAPSAHQKQFVELAAKNRLPAIYGASNYVEAGGLISYGTERKLMFERTAIYVDKILKGAKPADLPVEAPKDFALVINLKTAKQISVIIPPSLLARADKVIK